MLDGKTKNANKPKAQKSRGKTGKGGKRIRLQLLKGAPGGADSIFFEQVPAYRPG